MHSHPRRDSWATFLRLSHARAESEFLTRPDWDQPAKGGNPDRKHWSSRIARGWAWGWQLHPRKKCHENWRSNSRLWLAEASEEGQGPHKTVEPMMMMINKKYYIFGIQLRPPTGSDSVILLYWPNEPKNMFRKALIMSACQNKMWSIS
jgi:hypothetical protein